MRALFLYALKTNWKLNLGHIIFESMCMFPILKFTRAPPFPLPKSLFHTRCFLSWFSTIWSPYQPRPRLLSIYWCWLGQAKAFILSWFPLRTCSASILGSSSAHPVFLLLLRLCHQVSLLVPLFLQIFTHLILSLATPLTMLSHVGLGSGLDGFGSHFCHFCPIIC